MKLLLVFVVASLLTVSLQQSIQQTLTEWRNLVSPHINRCMCQSGTKPGVVEAFFELGEFSTDPCFKCNLKCWQEGVGVLTAAGNVNLTRLNTVFGITQEIVQKCGNNVHVDICEKAYEISLCTYNMIANSRPVLPVAPRPAPSKVKLWDPFPQFPYGKQ